MRRLIRFALTILVSASFAGACDWGTSDRLFICSTDDSDGTEAAYCHLEYATGPTETDPREVLARCLTERGIVLYGTTWCGACQQQRELFGPYAELLNGVNCSLEPDRCRRDGIRVVPTWIFPDGSRHEGLRDLRQLARRARCPYPDR